MVETARRYQPRGSKGKFIKTKSEKEGGIGFISSLISASEGDGAETLIDIKITNPLKKIYDLIKEIKDKQTTTFNLKMTIPLVALPIFIFGAFELGRNRGLCEQYFASKVGIVRNISVMVPEERKSYFEFLKLFNINYPKSNYEMEQRAILIGESGETISILSHKKYDLAKYNGRKVILSGTYSSCTGIITLVDENNISVL